MRFTTPALAIAAAMIVAPAAAHASPVNQTEFSETVQHDDLDLATQNGIARLDERIRTRIRQACANGGRDSASVRLERECRASAFASAEQQVRFAINEARLRNVRLANSSDASGASTPGA